MQKKLINLLSRQFILSVLGLITVIIVPKEAAEIFGIVSVGILGISAVKIFLARFGVTENGDKRK